MKILSRIVIGLLINLLTFATLYGEQFTNPRQEFWAKTMGPLIDYMHSMRISGFWIAAVIAFIFLYFSHIHKILLCFFQKKHTVVECLKSWVRMEWSMNRFFFVVTPLQFVFFLLLAVVSQSGMSQTGRVLPDWMFSRQALINMGVVTNESESITVTNGVQSNQSGVLR